MPDGALTRQEVEALISANEKVATQLALIAVQLQTNAAVEKAVLDRLQTNLSQDVTSIKSSTDQIPELVKMQRWLQWTITAIGGVVGMVGLKFVFELLGGRRP